MGKAIGGHSQGAPLTASRKGEEVFALGGWLAKQRRLRGIRLEELAALTRLPVRSLERLEAGAFDGQQDGFVRGFVRTVALAIGLDPEDAVARLLAEPDARPGSRLPEVRALVAAVIGFVGAVALAVAAWQLATAPSADESEGPPLVRRDAVRALAVEKGLLPEDRETTPGSPAVLLLEPSPADAARSDAPARAEEDAPFGASRRAEKDAPLGASPAPPAALAAPD